MKIVDNHTLHNVSQLDKVRDNTMLKSSTNGQKIKFEVKDKIEISVENSNGDFKKVESHNLNKQLREVLGVIKDLESLKSVLDETRSYVTSKQNSDGESVVNLNFKLNGGVISDATLAKATYDKKQIMTKYGDFVIGTQSGGCETHYDNKEYYENYTATDYVNGKLKFIYRGNSNANTVLDGNYLYVLSKKGCLHILEEQFAANGGNGQAMATGNDVPRLCHSYILKGGNESGGNNDKDYQYGHPVACAGFMQIQNGKIVKIDNGSGHYKPTERQLKLASIYLLSKDVLDSTITVSPHHSNKPFYINDVKNFDKNELLNEFSKRGRYQAIVQRAQHFGILNTHNDHINLQPVQIQFAQQPFQFQNIRQPFVCIQQHPQQPFQFQFVSYQF